MEETRFDAMVKTLGSLATRRFTLGALLERVTKPPSGPGARKGVAISSTALGDRDEGGAL